MCTFVFRTLEVCLSIRVHMIQMVDTVSLELV